MYLSLKLHNLFECLSSVIKQLACDVTLSRYHCVTAYSNHNDEEIITAGLKYCWSIAIALTMCQISYEVI